MALNLNDSDHSIVGCTFCCCPCPALCSSVCVFIVIDILGNAMQQLKSMKSRTFELTKKKVEY